MNGFLKEPACPNGHGRNLTTFAEQTCKLVDTLAKIGSLRVLRHTQDKRGLLNRGIDRHRRLLATFGLFRDEGLLRAWFPNHVIQITLRALQHEGRAVTAVVALEPPLLPRVAQPMQILIFS